MWRAVRRGNSEAWRRDMYLPHASADVLPYLVGTGLPGLSIRLPDGWLRVAWCHRDQAQLAARLTQNSYKYSLLNLPEQCSGGTGIYRHLPTGKTNVVQQKTEIDWMEREPLTEPLSYSAGEWELLDRIEMRYNRLVAFNGSAMHKIFIEPGEAPFGPAVEDSRLGLTTFFRYPETLA